MTILTTACAKTAPVVHDLASEPLCVPEYGFEHRWTRSEREFCKSLNLDITQARAAEKPQPFSSGVFGKGASP